MNLNSRLDAIQRAIDGLHRDTLLIEFRDGSQIHVTAGDAVLMCRTHDDIARVRDTGRGNDMLAALIEGLYTN